MQSNVNQFPAIQILNINNSLAQLTENYFTHKNTYNKKHINSSATHSSC